MKRIFLLFILCLLTISLSAQILTFDFAGLAGNEASALSNSNNANLNSSTISRGSGVSANSNADRFNSTGWTTLSSVDLNDYVQFTISPQSGYQFSVSSIYLQHQRSGTGPVNFVVRYSLDGYSANLGGVHTISDVTTTQNYTFSFTQSNQSIAVTYRIYAYSAEAAGGSWGPGDGTGNDIIVYGDVSPTSSSNDSDSEVNGPALALQPDPVIISSLFDTDPESVRVFDFDVYDYGTSDELPTIVTLVTIKPGTNNTANWANTIAGAKLSKDGGTTFVTTGTPVITASSIVFPISSGNLDIANSDAETVSLYIYLKTSGLVDNSVLEFNIPATLHGFTADASGSQFATTIVGATSNDMLIDVVATELRFVQQPSNTNVNVVMTPPVTVQSTDVNGNRDLDFSSSVSITSTGTLASSPVVSAAINGLATFSTLIHTAMGNGLTLTAERDGAFDWDVISNQFSIMNMPTASDVRINELDADQTGTDTQEFIELFGTPNFDLTGLTIVFFNGNGDISYYSTDLDGKTLDGNGYFILGNAGAPGNPDIIFTNDLLQNGADAVALYFANASDFPNGTPVTSTNLIDALVYDTDDADDSGLLSGLNQTEQINENLNTQSTTQSIQRGSWFVATPTPRAVNSMPVILVNYKVQAKGNITNIIWSTSSEINNSHFLIEWSRDANEWNEIGTVKAGGTTHDIKEYTFIHENPKAGINYYRLTQVDFDGRKETFPVKSVYFGSNQRNFDIIPNLAFNNVKIEFEKPVENGRLHIYNIDGQFMQSYVLASGIDVLRIDVSELPSGQYIAKYIDGEDTINRKFIKQ
ncbi:MAG: T9SS type A sorting domain-containing protein [Deltaproteobacteria bacterium]